ncbi:MAG: DUF1460 domain-containing protein [Bacteroidales bacterium]|nr:DUF1460 domain-containing protein [Bacteroidales bacterium]
MTKFDKNITEKPYLLNDRGLRNVFLWLIFVCSCTFTHAQENADSLVFCDFLDYAIKENINEKETGDRIISIAKFFLEKPYVASTLETAGTESLLVNLRELDCTTLVETVLALHNVLKETKPDFETYKRILTSIRYRNGMIIGYPSRLHYTTDWLQDNQHKGFITLVLPSCTSDTLNLNLNFMSTHSPYYPALKNNPANIEEISKIEVLLSKKNLHYIPKQNLTGKFPDIHNGDIIAITTSIKGLDFSHLGFAYCHHDTVNLLHASFSFKKVIISTQSLKDYLSAIDKYTGIVIARPL